MIINKPIVIFDIETTGLDIINDQIIDISLIKIDLDSSEKLKQYKIKPAIKISKESTEIHGISDEDVENCKSFQFYSKDIFDFIKGCDLGGFNILKFDLPILIEEFMRCNIELKLENIKIIDALRLYHLMEKRNLSSAYKFYCNKILENAHSAKSDTIATYEILLEQIKKYDELSNNVDSLSKFSNNDLNFVDLAGFIRYNKKGLEVFSFGKYKNISLENIWKKNPGYFSWVKNAEFPVFTKIIIDNFIKKMKLIEKFKE